MDFQPDSPPLAMETDTVVVSEVEKPQGSEESTSGKEEPEPSTSSQKPLPDYSAAKTGSLKFSFMNIHARFHRANGPGRVAQSVTCQATDASLTANTRVASSIPVRSHTFVEIDHEIISTVILLPFADSFKKGCCQLQAKVCARSTG